MFRDLDLQFRAMTLLADYPDLTPHVSAELHG